MLKTLETNLNLCYDADKKYCLMMSVAPRAFARGDHSRRNQRGRMNIASGKGPRSWNVHSPIFAILKSRLVEMTGSAERTVHSIERLLNEASQSTNARLEILGAARKAAKELTSLEENGDPSRERGMAPISN